MIYRDHGAIPLAKPEPEPQNIILPDGRLVLAFVDVQADHMFAIWQEGQGWANIAYNDFIPGRWLRGWSIVYHDGWLKLCLVSSAPNDSVLSHGFAALWTP